MLSHRDYQLIHQELDQPLASVVSKFLFKDENTPYTNSVAYQLEELIGRPTNYVELKCTYQGGMQIRSRVHEVQIKEVISLQQFTESNRIDVTVNATSTTESSATFPNGSKSIHAKDSTEIAYGPPEPIETYHELHDIIVSFTNGVLGEVGIM